MLLLTLANARTTNNHFYKYSMQRHLVIKNLCVRCYFMSEHNVNSMRQNKGRLLRPASDISRGYEFGTKL